MLGIAAAIVCIAAALFCGFSVYARGIAAERERNLEAPDLLAPQPLTPTQKLKLEFTEVVVRGRALPEALEECTVFDSHTGGVKTIYVTQRHRAGAQIRGLVWEKANEK